MMRTVKGLQKILSISKEAKAKAYKNMQKIGYLKKIYIQKWRENYELDSEPGGQTKLERIWK